MSVYVILLRAIGPVTHKVMSMAAWRDAVAAAGFDTPETYLATGNMVASGGGTLPQVTTRMNEIVRDLGLAANNIAVVRTPAHLRAIVEADPFPDASAERPSRMQVYFFASPKPDFGWVDDYDGHERLAVVDGHLVVDYGGQISDSPKLAGIVEKRSGPGTGRNWNTLKGLVARATAREQEDS